MPLLTPLRLACLTLAALTVAAGCRWRPFSTPAPSYVRVAFLPLEDLSAPPSPRPLGALVAEMAALRLDGASQSLAFRAATRDDALRLKADRIVSGYFSERDGVLRATLICEDVRRLKTLWTKQLRLPAAGAPAALATSIVAEFDPPATSSTSFRPEAIELYLKAEKISDPPSRARALEGCLQLEPRLPAPYFLLADLKLAQGDQEGARKILTHALSLQPPLPPSAASRLALKLATLEGDREKRRLALLSLAQAAPSDGWVFRALAELDFHRRDFSSSSHWYRQAIQRDPQDPALWNQLGYAEAFAGNLPAARQCFARYQSLEPASANPLDSLGDTLFYHGLFLEAAERYLEAFAREETFLSGGALYKAAIARLLDGAVREADQLYQQFVEERAARAQFVSPLEQSQWDYISGRRDQAHSTLHKLAQTPARPGFDPGHALAQCAFWRIEEGNLAEAQRLAALALAKAVSPAGRTYAKIVAVMAAPVTSPSALNEALLRQFPSPPEQNLRRLIAAYTLVAQQRWSEAIPFLEQMLPDSPPQNPEPIAYLLGRARLETGAFDKIGNLLDGLPINTLTGDPFFNAQTVPSFLATRARWLHQQGQSAAARPYREAFARLLPSPPPAPPR